MRHVSQTITPFSLNACRAVCRSRLNKPRRKETPKLAKTTSFVNLQETPHESKEGETQGGRVETWAIC